LPVLDTDDWLIGVVSERDLLSEEAHPVPEDAHWWQGRAARAELRRAAGDTVDEVRTELPITVAPDPPLAEAAARMIEHEVERLPVVDRHGALVGVVSRSDLLRSFLRTTTASAMLW
jgi:CBS-domain-containing membrane protein